jgi:hypothetical protein
MANRTRRVPPPPPPPPPVAAPRERALPVARPRRLDIPNIGSRTEPRRRPAWTLDTDWPPVDFDSTEQESAPKQLPGRPKNPFLDFGEDDDAPETPTGTIRWSKPARPVEPKESAKLLNVPVICTKFDRPFVLVFRETRSVFGTRYRLDATLTDVGEGGEASPSLTVPISSLDWGGIKCPHCRSQCRPIHCGQCQRLACDGRVTTSGDGILFACAPSCGMSGWVRGSLQTVTGSEGRRSPPPVTATALISGPGTPPENVPKLPKPR